MISFWNDKVRPVLQKYPGIALGVAGSGVIAAAFYAFFSLHGGGPSIANFSSYYTTDDGKTLFEDNDPNDIPPFDHDGHEAVQAYFIPGPPPARWIQSGTSRR